MSTIATPQFIHPCYAAQRPTLRAGARAIQAAQSSAKLTWSLVATAFIVGVVFFVAGHDFLTSRAVAYTQTAEEMQTAALGGNLLRRVAFLALAGWGLQLFAAGKQQLKIDWPLASSLFALVALATASVLWSEDPAMCIRRLLVLFCCGIAAAGVRGLFRCAKLPGWWSLSLDRWQQSVCLPRPCSARSDRGPAIIALPEPCIRIRRGRRWPLCA